MIINQNLILINRGVIKIAKKKLYAFFCPKCHEYYKEDDACMLDLNHSVLHAECYAGNHMEIIDRGTYREILEKYSFFEELLYDGVEG